MINLSQSFWESVSNYFDDSLIRSLVSDAGYSFIHKIATTTMISSLK